MLKFAGDPKVDKYAEEIIRTLSNYPISVSHGIVAANIIEEMIMRNSHTTSDEIIDSVREKIKLKFPDAEESICNVRKHTNLYHLDFRIHICFTTGEAWFNSTKKVS